MKFTDFKDFINNTNIIVSNTVDNQVYTVSELDNGKTTVNVSLGEHDNDHYTITQAETPTTYPAHFLLNYQGNLHYYVVPSEEDSKQLVAALAPASEHIYSAVTVSFASLEPVLKALAAKQEERAQAEAAATAQAEAAAKLKAEEEAAALAKIQALAAAQEAAKAAHLALVEAQEQKHLASVPVKQLTTKFEEESDKNKSINEDLLLKDASVKAAAKVLESLQLTSAAAKATADTAKAAYENALDDEKPNALLAADSALKTATSAELEVEQARKELQKADDALNTVRVALAQSDVVIEATLKERDAAVEIETAKQVLVDVAAATKEAADKALAALAEVPAPQDPVAGPSQNPSAATNTDEDEDEVVTVAPAVTVASDDAAKTEVVAGAGADAAKVADNTLAVVPHAKPYVSAEAKSLTTTAAFMAAPYAGIWAVCNLGLFQAAVSSLVFSALVVPAVAGLAMRQIYIYNENKRFQAENPTASLEEKKAAELAIETRATVVAGNFVVAYAATQIVTHFALSALSKNLTMGAMISGSPLEAQLVMMALAGVAFGATMMFMTAMKMMHEKQPMNKAAGLELAKSFAVGLVTGIGIHAAGMIPGLNAAYGHAMPGWTASTLAVAGQLLAVAVPFAGTMLVDAPSYKPVTPKDDVKVEEVTPAAAPTNHAAEPEDDVKVDAVTPVPAAPVKAQPVTQTFVTSWMSKLKTGTTGVEKDLAKAEAEAANNSAKAKQPARCSVQ